MRLLINNDKYGNPHIQVVYEIMVDGDKYIFENVYQPIKIYLLQSCLSSLRYSKSVNVSFSDIDIIVENNKYRIRFSTYRDGPEVSIYLLKYILDRRGIFEFVMGSIAKESIACPKSEWRSSLYLKEVYNKKKDNYIFKVVENKINSATINNI